MQETGRRQRSSHTSIVLLLLVVVTELSFPLGGHPTLGLHHLFRLIGATLEALRGVEALETGGGMTARRIEFAHGVMALGGHVAAHPGVFRSIGLDRCSEGMGIDHDPYHTPRSGVPPAPAWNLFVAR